MTNRDSNFYVKPLQRGPHFFKRILFMIIICHVYSASETLWRQSPLQKGSSSKKWNTELTEDGESMHVSCHLLRAHHCAKHFLNVMASSLTTLKMSAASFTDKETGSERLADLPWVTHTVSSRIRMWSLVCSALPVLTQCIPLSKYKVYIYD